MKAMLLICLPVIGCLVLTGGAVRAQQPDEQIRQVFADWEKRREAIKRIRYTVVGQDIRPMGSMTDDMGRPFTPPNPPKDVAMRQDSTLLLDLEKKRFRLEMAGEKYYLNGQQTFPWATTTLFDGLNCAAELPREANENTVVPRKATDPDVSINRNYARSGFRPLMVIETYGLSPLLIAHGLIPQWSHGAVEFDKRPDPDDFTVHGRHFFNGRDCLVLRTFPERNGPTTSFDEFWIDAAHDSAVVYKAGYTNDKLRVSIDISYQQTSHGWLPLHWTGTIRNGAQPIEVTRQTVQKLDIEPAVVDKDFQPDVKPGMYVYETIHKDLDAFGSQPNIPKVYHVAANGSWNEVIDGVEYKNRTRYWYGAGGVLAAVAIAAVVSWYWRRRGKGNTRPSLAGA